MKFWDWWHENYPEGAGYSIAEKAWNAALEEAAKRFEGAHTALSDDSAALAAGTLRAMKTLAK
jgi:hypothetical protein